MLALLSEVTTVEQKVHLDVGILTFIVATLIPVLTAMVTRTSASSKVKAITTLTLTVIAVAIERLITVNGVVNLKTFLANLAVTWFIAITTYYGLLKPTGVTAKTADATSGVGIGKAA